MEDQKTTALIDEKDHVVRFSLSSITTTNSSSNGNEQHRSSDGEINTNTNTKQNSETSNQTTNITSPSEWEQSKESRKIVENEDRSELDKQQDTSIKPQSPIPSDTNNNSVLLQQNQQQSSSSSSPFMSSNALTMSASKLTQQLAPVSVNTKDTLNNRDSSTLKATGDGVVVSVISSGSSSMVSSCSLSSGSGGSSNEPTMTNSQISPNVYKSINSSLLSNVSEDSSSPSGGFLSSLEGTNQKSFSSSGESNKSSTPQMKKSGGESVSSTTPTLTSSSTTSSASSQQTVLSSNKKKTPNSGSKSSKKPWYSAFVNTYKQKNEDFRRLFKLPPEEHLLVDYSAAMQREILAHGRLYVSLNYVCFRANIIGWETTIIIKFKDIRSIYKDKTAKIIPNAISIVLDNEKYFFTSFISRDKTYATLFRIWQMALSDSLMSNEEIDTILKSCYGEDLGYNSDDAEYEYYSKLKDKSNNQDTMDIADYSIHQSLSFIEPNRMSAQNANNAVETSSAKEMIFSDTEIGVKPTNSAVRFDTSSFSDDQSNVTNRQQAQHTSPKRKSTNHQIHSSSSSGSSFSPYVPPSAAAAVGHTSLINQNFAHQHNSHHPGHRQSSSFDTAMIDTSENFNQADGERPRSMVGGQLQTQKFNHQHKANKKRAPMHPTQQLNSIPSNSSNAVDLKVDPIDLINAQNEANNGEENKSTEVTTSPVAPNVESTGRELNGTTRPSGGGGNQERSDSSSSVEFDANEHDSDVPSAITHTAPLHNVKCSCGEHPGKEMLNQVYAVTVNYLWECLFGHTTFCRNYWESRKFGNIKVGEWKLVNNYPFRQLEFTVDLGGAIGRPKNTEEQKILEYRPNECIVLESESFTHGIPYSDCFTTRNRFCLTRVNSTSTRLCIYSFLNFVQKPNFIAKSFIERNAMGALKDSYNYLASLIANEYINGDSASCHENDANLKRLIYSSSAITAHPNRPHKSMSASALLSTSKQPQQRRPKQDTTTTNTLLITAASNSVGESCSIFERTREFDENGNMLEEELSAQQFSREKTIPGISVPANNRLAAHISAITDETSGALKHSQLKSAKMPNLVEQETSNRSGSPAGGGLTAKQQLTSTINSSTSNTNKHRHHNHHNHHNQQQQHVTANTGADMPQQPQHHQQTVPANGSPSNRAPRKKRPSCSPQDTPSLDDVGLASPADFRQSAPPNVSSPICPPNSSPPITQLVPIQKFSFFKWEVNVDTLVRLFIVAMICLMVINAMLYYKLRRIESLADSIRNDPSLMTRMNMADRQFESVLIEAQSSNTNLERESNDWRNLISKTLDAIEKMENSLRQWDKTLESREKQPLSSTLPAAKPDL